MRNQVVRTNPSLSDAKSQGGAESCRSVVMESGARMRWVIAFITLSSLVLGCKSQLSLSSRRSDPVAEDGVDVGDATADDGDGGDTTDGDLPDTGGDQLPADDLTLAASDPTSPMTGGGTQIFKLTTNTLSDGETLAVSLAYAHDGVDFTSPVPITPSNGTYAWTAPEGPTRIGAKLRFFASTSSGRTAVATTPPFDIFCSVALTLSVSASDALVRGGDSQAFTLTPETLEVGESISVSVQYAADGVTFGAGSALAPTAGRYLWTVRWVRRFGREAILRHLSPEESLDAMRPDEYRQHFQQVAFDEPNVAHTLEILEIDGRPAILQEWLMGLTATDWPPLAAASGVCFRLMTQAALGLSALHRAGVLHGRLSDGHLLLTPDGQVKILGAGEPHWISPPSEEVAEPRDDLRALGRIVSGWCTPTGVRKGPKTKPIPDSLVSILYRLNADGEQSFASAQELLDALETLTDIPGNNEAWERLLKYVRDHQTPEIMLRATG